MKEVAIMSVMIKEKCNDKTNQFLYLKERNRAFNLSMGHVAEIWRTTGQCRFCIEPHNDWPDFPSTQFNGGQQIDSVSNILFVPD